MALPSETGGRIDPGTDVDYFRFEVSETREVTAGTPGNNNTWVTLENSEGVELERNTVQDGANYHTPRRNLSAGTCYVRVDAYQSRIGAYTLRLTAEDADPEPPDGGGGDGDDACSVGLVLGPGDYCTFGANRFRVRSNGSACYEGPGVTICVGANRIEWGGLVATRVSGTNADRRAAVAVPPAALLPQMSVGGMLIRVQLCGPTEAKAGTMRKPPTLASALCALLLSTTAHGENTYTVPLFHGTLNESGQGFVRILNASNRSGAVSITAWDDAGSEFGPLTLAIDASSALHFNSNDLEGGNPSKGLTGSTGPGQGDWRLRLTTELNLVVLAFVRTADGFLTSIHDTALVLARRPRRAS